ncbi:MAG: class I SAM-dependent rRNA methyltransferase [Thermodesulfobacteriota bacterium]
MSDYPELSLLPGREKSLALRHPWIFSGAFSRLPDGLENGSPVHVRDSRGKVLATGTYSAGSMIRVRVMAFSRVTLSEEFFRERISRARELRLQMGYGPGAGTTGFRMVFGESDGLPGLIADWYDGVLVLQMSTPGIERLRQPLLSALEGLLRPKAVLARNELPVRDEEGLEKTREVLSGSLSGPAPFTENGLNFVSDAWEGQKTGFFLDQKDLRRDLARLCQGARVLNLFSYTGAAGIYALSGGAKSVLNIDASERALSLCREHAERNGIAASAADTERADVFSYLTAKNHPQYDMVVMDPPAIIKSAKDKQAGAKAYHFLNREALSLVRPGGVFVTSSCSAHFTRDDFFFMLKTASVKSGRSLFPLAYPGQSPDHPRSVYFPEAEYLKSAIFAVS